VVWYVCSFVVGTMGVGKSTIAKQMAISFGDGLSEGDRSVSRQAIVKNIVSSTVTVIKEAPNDTVHTTT
jgi:shikimate kinase